MIGRFTRNHIEPIVDFVLSMSKTQTEAFECNPPLTLLESPLETCSTNPKMHALGVTISILESGTNVLVETISSFFMPEDSDLVEIAFPSPAGLTELDQFIESATLRYE